MGREGFAMVFAPSSSKISESRDKHRKSAKACLVVLLGLILGAGVCLYILMGPLSESFAAVLEIQLALGGLVLEIICAIGALIALGYHSYKAEHFESLLENEYITATGRWNRMEFYN